MSKMVYCRTCGAHIAKSAKRCPQCGAKQKKGHGFLKFLLLVIIVLAVFLFLMSSGILDSNGKKTPDDVSTALTEKKESETEKNSEKETTVTEESGEDAEAEETSVSSTEPADVDSGNDTNADGVNADLKEFLDSYEDFMTEYCDFMSTYDDNNPLALVEYGKLVAEYADFVEKCDAYEEEEMSDEDLKYYLEVTNRVNLKLIDLNASLDE